MTLQQIVERTRLPKVTAFRLLKTWISLGYATHDRESKSYALSPRILSLGFPVLMSIPLREVALPYLHDLSRTTNQNVNLGIVDGAEIFYIERIKRKRILNIDNYVGTRLKVCESSIGKAAIAFMRDSDLKTTLCEILKGPDADKRVGIRGENLLKELEGIRKKGYAVVNEELMKGLRSIAAPVLGADGTSEGAINLPVFSMEVSLKTLMEQYLPLLLETAGQISAARGFFGQVTAWKKR